MSIDIGSTALRIFDGLEADFGRMCFETSKALSPLVESEIELMVLGTFQLFTKTSPLRLKIGDEVEENDDFHIMITPQFQWKGFRIDFCFRALKNPERMYFVECDGHDFHERTKEQAERDRAKDRAIQLAGISILRFTGREIWRNPCDVCLEIFNFIHQDLNR